MKAKSAYPHPLIASKIRSAITASFRRSLLGALGVMALTSQAAPIIWGPATGISGDLDVSTTPGTLLGAFNVGPVGGVSGTTINGVTFNPFAIPQGALSVSLGNFTLATADARGLLGANSSSAAAPFSTLSPSYQSLLSPVGFTEAPDATMTLTLSGLTAGAHYEFQWWSNLSVSAGGSTTATAGNNVTLGHNTTLAAGGLGQFAIGTFTADALDQSITFLPSRGGQPILNGFQLRSVSAVPEAGSTLAGVLALGACLIGLGRRHWRQ